MQQLGELRWKVCKAGYECVAPSQLPKGQLKGFYYHILDQSQLNAVIVQPVRLLQEPSPSFRQYNPMKKVGLFRQFANLGRSPESILRFADRYGLLFGSPDVGLLDDWHTTAASMRKAVRLYDLSYSEPSDEVREEILATLPWVAWRDRQWGEPEHREPAGNSNLTLGSTHLLPYESLDNLVYEPVGDVAQAWRKAMGRDAIRVARWAVRTVVNAELARHVEPVLHARNFFDEETSGLSFQPTNLLGALWLQFALQIASMMKRALCQACGRPFWWKTASASGRERSQRIDTKYCSARCKVAACRKRQRLAANQAQQPASDASESNSDAVSGRSTADASGPASA